MAIDFPNSPRPESGDVYTGPNGVSYTFDGIKWIGQEQSSGGGAGLPDQTGQAGKFLTTDGSGNASWADAQGPKGDAATITLGTVSTGAAGSSVVINNGGNSSAAVFNFTIPRGDKGNAATVTVGTVTTGLPGSSVLINNTGTANDAVFAFTVPRGDKGEQGVRGEQGEPGAEGQQGSQGVPGSPGSPGAPGQKGDQGVPGNTGAKGDTGSPGAAGADGAKGDPGDTGPRGEKGDQGLPGNDSTVQGPKGDTGDQGVSVTLQGTKATIADLPLTGSAGHGWIVTTGDGLTHLNGSLWFWNIADGAWNDIGPIVGPQGDKGDPGDQGAKGDQGLPGNNGAPGADGAKGDTGDTGPPGDPGLPGASGAKGDQGLPGEPGQTGEQGLPGQTGEQGVPGEKGDQGLPGEPGQTGEQGPPGQTGEQGVPGVPGQGVSTGGSIGQVLAKLSGDDYDTGWVDQLSNIDRLTAGEYNVILGTDGKLTFPNGSTIGDGDAVFGVPITTTRGSILIGNQAECLGGENHFHIMKAGQQEIDLFLGDDNNYVKLPSTGGVEISSSEIGAQYYWTFGTDGKITFPGADGFQATFGSVEPIGDVLHSVNSLVLESEAAVNLFSGNDIAELEMLYDGELTLLTNLLSAELYGTSFLPASHDSIIALSAAKAINPLISDQIITVAQAVSDAWDDWQAALTASVVNITVGNYGWHFGPDGKLTFPDGFNIDTTTFTNTTMLFGAPTGESGTKNIVLSTGEITNTIFIPGTVFADATGAGNTDLLSLSGKNGVGITTGSDGLAHTQYNWTFDTDGGLTFPDDTTQYTAYQGVTITSDTAPTGELGRLWYNSTDGRTYIKYNDQWVDANPPVVPHVSTYLSGLTIDEQTISSVDHASPDVKIAGNLLPDQDLTYDLGSPTNQWNSLHIKDTTIYMSGRALSLTNEGLKVDGQAAITVLDGGHADTWLLPV